MPSLSICSYLAALGVTCATTGRRLGSGHVLISDGALLTRVTRCDIKGWKLEIVKTS